jgi:hypothetical protein
VKSTPKEYLQHSPQRDPSNIEQPSIENTYEESSGGAAKII